MAKPPNLPKVGSRAFEALPVPAGNPAPGAEMNADAVRRLIAAHAAGWTADELADLYGRLKLQIEAAAPGWTADRGICLDGSHVFLGSQGRTLAIRPDRTIWVGNLGVGGKDALLSYSGMQRLPDGRFAFPPPNVTATSSKQIA